MATVVVWLQVPSDAPVPGESMLFEESLALRTRSNGHQAAAKAGGSDGTRDGSGAGLDPIVGGLVVCIDVGCWQHADNHGDAEPRGLATCTLSHVIVVFCQALPPAAVVATCAD
jgi:hypothetical protein